MAANVTMCIHMLASHRKKHMVSQIGHVSSWIIAFWLGYKSTIQACGTADGLICSCLQVWIMWILTPNYWTAQSSDPHPIERSIGYDFAQSICIYIYIYVQYVIWLVTTKKNRGCWETIMMVYATHLGRLTTKTVEVSCSLMNGVSAKHVDM